MVDALLPIGDLRFQSLVEPPGNFAQKHAGLAGRVEKPGLGIAPERLRQEVQHLIGQLRRREDLVAGEIGQAGKHIGVVTSRRRHGLPPENAPADTL